MKRFFLLSLTALVLTFSASATSDAISILDKALERFKSVPSVTAAYTLTASGEKVSGRVSFAGNKFTMTSPTLLTWFDGSTQWAYNKANNEVTVTEPSADELAQINPFSIIDNFRNAYTAKTLDSPTGFVKIQLTAKDPKAEISVAEVTINDKSLLPSQIVLTTRNKQSISIILSSVATGKKYNIKAFQFYAPNYPGVQIVDLR